MGWLEVAQSLGIPVLCLVSLAVAVWRVGVWVGVNIAKPVADRHIKFLDDLSVSQATQSTTLQMMTVQHGKSMEILLKVVQGVDAIVAKQDAILVAFGDNTGIRSNQDARKGVT